MHKVRMCVRHKTERNFFLFSYHHTSIYRRADSNAQLAAVRNDVYNVLL